MTREGGNGGACRQEKQTKKKTKQKQGKKGEEVWQALI